MPPVWHVSPDTVQSTQRAPLTPHLVAAVPAAQLCPVLSQHPAQTGQSDPPSPTTPLLLEPELEDVEPELELDDDPPLDPPELLDVLPPLLLEPAPLLVVPELDEVAPELELDDVPPLDPPELLDVLPLPAPGPLDEPTPAPESAPGPSSIGLRPPVAHAPPTQRTKRPKRPPEILGRRLFTRGLLRKCTSIVRRLKLATGDLHRHCAPRHDRAAPRRRHFVPNSRSPASPIPGTMYPRSSRRSSIEAVNTGTSGCVS